MTKMTFTRTVSIEPEDAELKVTLAALEGLVRNARRLNFSDDAEVYVMAHSYGTSGYRIGVTEH